MLSTVKLAPLGLLFLTLGACRSAGPSGRPRYFLEIEARNRHLESAFRAGNLLGVADVYADDAVLIDAHGTRTSGRAEIDEYWSALEDPLDWELELRTIRGSEAVAYETGVSRLTTRQDGVPRTLESEFVLLWRRDPDGEWRITLDAYWPKER
ncbi:MAG: SgcJ/EcaC family oxidoreductase [Planctomycetes bacterium]|nr:SgcJ/EcaC family oxidoreductase [Planctomycetota bacterium]